MIGRCEYCNEKLSNVARVDMRFCSDDCRVKFHNQKRSVKSAFNKASKAIADLQEMADKNSKYSWDAKDYLRRLFLQIKQDADS